MNYSVYIQRSAQKAIENISSPFKNKIINSIYKLGNDPGLQDARNCQAVMPGASVVIIG